MTVTGKETYGWTAGSDTIHTYNYILYPLLDQPTQGPTLDHSKVPELLSPNPTRRRKIHHI